MPVLHEKLAAARAQLVAAGSSTAEATIDVDLYARTILGWDRSRLLTELRSPAPDTLEPTFSDWLARREQREPTAYILGVREFWGLDFAVSGSVLIPRPESELIVDEAIGLLRDVRVPRVADVGSGSGCLAISIAYEVPAARVVATDISADALVVARANAERHGLLDRVTFAHTSHLDGVSGPFDVIVANVPYVKDGDRPALSRQVAGYEPHVALFGGADGLRDITAVLDAATDKLAPGGWFIFEFGLGQDDRILKLVARYPQLQLERLRRDLQDIPRTAVVRRL